MEKHALVVDDDVHVLTVLAEILAELGFHVYQALGGQQALDIISSGVPIDIVITDLHMPEISGDEVLATARSNRGSLPAIVITGSNPVLPAGLRETSTTLVIAKPCSIAELHAAIRNLGW